MKAAGLGKNSDHCKKLRHEAELVNHIAASLESSWSSHAYLLYDTIFRKPILLLTSTTLTEIDCSVYKHIRTISRMGYEKQGIVVSRITAYLSGRKDAVKEGRQIFNPMNIISEALPDVR